MFKNILILGGLLIGAAHAQCISDIKGLKIPISYDNDARYTFLDISLDYNINLSLTGSALPGQSLYYDVKDESGTQVVAKTLLNGNSTAITWHSKIRDITHFKGVVPSKEYILTVYGVDTKYTDRYGSVTDLSTALQFHIQQTAKNITTTYSNENDDYFQPEGTCRDYVTFNGSLGIKLSTLTQGSITGSISDNPSDGWKLINNNRGQKNIHDYHFYHGSSDLYYDSKAYSTSYLGSLNAKYPWSETIKNGINLKITLPYVQSTFVSPKMTQQPTEYTLGYQFNS